MTGFVRVRRIRLAECLHEVTQGVGPSWRRYRVVGATREGLAPAKEGLGKNPERYKLVEPGTIFYNPMRILLGSIAFLDEGQESGITSPDYVVFKTRPGLIHPRWFYYWLRSGEGAAFIRTLTRGAVRERMVFRRLTKTEVDVPVYELQLKFAQTVESVERARAAAEAQLEAAKALPTAYLRATFDSPEAQQWPRRRLGIISEIVGGIQKTPGRAPVRLHRPYLTVRNVQRGYLDLSRVERFEVTEAELSRLRLIPGDILIVEGNGSVDKIGRNALFTIDSEEWIHQNHVIRVRLSAHASVPEFVSLFLNSDQGRSQMIEKAKTTSGLYTLSSSKVASLEVPLPPLPEQQRILADLSAQMTAAEKTRKVLEEQLVAINALPAVLLRQAFSGEL